MGAAYCQRNDMIDGRREQVRHLSSTFGRTEAQLADPAVALEDGGAVDIGDVRITQNCAPKLVLMSEPAAFTAVSRARGVRAASAHREPLRTAPAPAVDPPTVGLRELTGRDPSRVFGAGPTGFRAHLGVALARQEAGPAYSAGRLVADRSPPLGAPPRPFFVAAVGLRAMVSDAQSAFGCAVLRRRSGVSGGTGRRPTAAGAGVSDLGDRPVVAGSAGRRAVPLAGRPRA